MNKKLLIPFDVMNGNYIKMTVESKKENIVCIFNVLNGKIYGTLFSITNNVMVVSFNELLNSIDKINNWLVTNIEKWGLLKPENFKVIQMYFNGRMVEDYIDSNNVDLESIATSIFNRLK
jgi:hypothetical protein